MKNVIRRMSLLAVIVTLAALSAWWYVPVEQDQDPAVLVEHKMDRLEKKAARSEYFFNMLRDPATNRIPNNIRSREIQFSRTLPGSGGNGLVKPYQSNTLRPKSGAVNLGWQSLGPTDLGGRTRALGIDQRNSNILIAGGVSGGIWKSIDGGATWALKSDPNQNMSVTSLAQHPTTPDTWYYTSGEFRGNSASDRGFTAFYHGTGVYKSTDNGETWSLIPSTEDTDTGFTSRFDYMSRVGVSPSTGSIFVASNAFGLLRSTDGGVTFPLLRGGMNQHAWTDFDIDSNGNIVAVFSSEDTGSSSGTAGIFYSEDDGNSWTDITPATMPDHDRSVIAFAPSAEDTVYVFSEKSSSSTNQGISFYMIDINDPQNPVAEDRSGNLPNFGGRGVVNLQGGYNMLVEVKPDNPEVVLVGATNLFRSTDGFATSPPDNTEASLFEYWIGGYGYNSSDNTNTVTGLYPGQHPDQHVAVFDPADPNSLWSGHDGGLSLTTDITTNPVVWSDKDDTYVTAQFYTVAIGPEIDDDRVMGGTQDNGTPFYRYDSGGNQTQPILDVSSGDGSYAHFGDNYAFVSSQGGFILRLEYLNDGGLGSAFAGTVNWSIVSPENATNQLFIHPYAVDPNADSVMYYPAGTAMWRNNNIDDIPNINQTSTGWNAPGWDQFTAVDLEPDDPPYIITTVTAARTPANRIYYGAYSPSGVPKLYRLDNATSSTAFTDISVPDAVSGAFPHDIAVNPQNGDEIVAVFSNYNITGIYHSTDGGDNWTAIEGNLEGDGANPGPSIRSATVFPGTTGTIVFVGTSTGLYSTDNIDGVNTIWTRESDDGSAGSIGFSVSEYVTSRVADGRIAVGTHGRGIFLGTIQAEAQDPGDTTPPPAPQSLTANNESETSDNVVLSWSPSNDDFLDKYFVYRGKEPNALALYDSTSTRFETEYLDSNAAPDSTYYYEVTAIDQNDNESTASNIAAILRQTVAIDTDWKLVGMPLTESSYADVPGNPQMISFNGAYQSANSLSPKAGHWVKAGTPAEITFNGNAFTESTVTLEAGWNLIGGIGDTVATADIIDSGGIRSATPVYHYAGGSYTEATELYPAGGYWIHADAAGDIQLEVAGVSAKRTPLLVDLPEGADEIVFSRQGRQQSIFVTGENVSRDQKMRHLMPPMAPAPVIDVRTSDGYRLATARKTELEIDTEAWPVKMYLKKGNSGNSYRIIGVSQGEEVYYDLAPGSSRLLTKAYDKVYLEQLDMQDNPLVFDLLPNYPNPFNPSTTIRYKLASKAFVSLEVYDILGRRVRQLVNKIQESGTYTLSFNGTNLSSGTYFIRIEAGDFSKIQKMTLIK